MQVMMTTNALLAYMYSMVDTMHHVCCRCMPLLIIAEEDAARNCGDTSPQNAANEQHGCSRARSPSPQPSSPPSAQPLHCSLVVVLAYIANYTTSSSRLRSPNTTPSPLDIALFSSSLRQQFHQSLLSDFDSLPLPHYILRYIELLPSLSIPHILADMGITKIKPLEILILGGGVAGSSEDFPTSSSLHHTQPILTPPQASRPPWLSPSSPQHHHHPTSPSSRSAPSPA